MKIVVTILEDSFERALDSIRALVLDHDAVEMRAERFASLDLAALRQSTAKPLILTHRGKTVSENTIVSAVEAGIDLIDVEYRPVLDNALIARHADRLVLSHHDYDAMPDVRPLIEAMCGYGCAHTKLAVTPATLEGNLRLLQVLAPGVTVIGMGERGLYSRILAPFLGSELAFVAPVEQGSGAPGQITLDRALAIYGPDRSRLHASSVFAIAGNPAGHSLSPSIHNPLFREKRVDAAYTIASFDTFDGIAAALCNGELRGVSVTAPFKGTALRFAEEIGATIGGNARSCGAANTLVRSPGGYLADNTDVDGFATLLQQICGRDRKSVALIGAGGTARAALVALAREGMHVTVFNRSRDRAAALSEAFGVSCEPLDGLSGFDGEIVINTLPATELSLPLRPGTSYIEAAYGDPRLAARCAALAEGGVQVFDGFDLLRAQAVRQNEIFVRALDGL